MVFPGDLSHFIKGKAFCTVMQKAGLFSQDDVDSVAKRKLH